MNKKLQPRSGALQGFLFGPKSEWAPPPEFPNLSGVKKIGFDLETRDPSLLEKGPGGIRGEGYPVGISLATEDRGWYFPFAHLGGGNMDKSSVVKFMADILGRRNLWCITANGQYDIEWADTLGIQVQAKVIDVQVAEALIDEDQEKYSLEAISTKYLGEGKCMDLLKQACAAHGIKNPCADLWKLHSQFMGPYAEYDAHCLLRISELQFAEMERQNLLEVFKLECQLMPILYKMRKQGVRINVEAANHLSQNLSKKEVILQADLDRAAKMKVDVRSGDCLAKMCHDHKIQHLSTPKGNPQFQAEWIEEQDHPLLEMVSELRILSNMRGTFIDKHILGNLVGNRIHTCWRPVASDEGGTRTGRFASSNPNLQQVPAAENRKGVPRPVGAAIRALFIPEDGMKWFKGDWSQQEPRILTHFASISDKTGAKLAAMNYIQNPNMDFYKFMQDAAGISRRFAKDMYLGRCYGMGKDKMAAKVGMSLAQAEVALAEVDLKIPFVKEMADTCMNLAQRRGWIRTICGRVCHFDFWEPINSWELRVKGVNTLPVKTKSLAEKKWPKEKLRRALTHKALNRLIQGSAADLMKSAIVRCYDELKWIPYMTVHDELDGGVADAEHAERIAAIMRKPVEKISIPMKVDVSIGEHWK